MLKLVNVSKTKLTECTGVINLQAENLMTYGSPLNCSTGNTANVTIKGDIVDSYITGCEDHYVLVKDSNDYNYCGMYNNISTYS